MYTVDAIQDGEQIYCAPVMNKDQAYYDYPRVIARILDTPDLFHAEVTVRLIRNGDIVAECTISTGSILTELIVSN